MTDTKSTRRQNWDIIFAVVAVIFLLLALFLNFYRYEFFGVVPGNAANNFAFNLSYFFPLTFSSLLLSVAVNFRVFAGWTVRPNLLKKILVLVLTTP
ncbi:MAG: hypothetical protein ABL872_15945, partial [Lacibacter sp.]